MEPEPELELEPAPPPTPPLEPLSDALDAPTPLVRWLSIHGAASGRKQALELLQGGVVAVNGEPCTTPARLIQSGRDEVSCSGEAVVPQCRHRHVLLHKPAGHVTARRSVRQLKGGGVEDDGRPTVYSLLDPETQARHCVAVGRLDVDTTGALLFTSNGMLAHYLLVPHFHVAKLYRATLRTAEPLSEAAIEQLARGVTLRTKAQTLCRGSARNVAGRPGVVELEIDGGAFHQVKHMLALVGRPLATLHRVAFANLVTEEDAEEEEEEEEGGQRGQQGGGEQAGRGGSRAEFLACGQCRELTAEEVAELYRLADAAASAAAAAEGVT